MQRICAHRSNLRHPLLTVPKLARRPGDAFLNRTARVMSAVLLFALVALPMACRSTTDPPSVPMANTAQPNQTPSASDDNGKEAMRRRLREARDRGDGTNALPVAGATNAFGGNEPATIEFNDVRLTDAILPLALVAGMNIQIDPALLNPQAADGTPIPSPTLNIKSTRSCASKPNKSRDILNSH